MSTKKHLETINTYGNLMQEIKIRISCINLAVAGNLVILPSPIVYEFCYLQLRMICELIGLSCLVAHGDIVATQAKKLIKEYKADEIMKQLSELHPEFYPQPCKHKESSSRSHHIEHLKDGFLTRDEIAKLYGKCGSILHKGNVKNLVKPKPAMQSNFSDVIAWKDKIINLLDTHLIVLFNEKVQYICIMRDGGACPQVATLEPMPLQEK